MNTYLVTAAILGFFVGLIHSVVGELMVFSRLRESQWVPTNGGNVLLRPHVRILWASWHVLTVLGWLAASVLWLLAAEPVTDLRSSLLQAIGVAMMLSSMIVLYGTKARHPGWVGLLGVAVLTYMGI